MGWSLKVNKNEQRREETRHQSSSLSASWLHVQHDWLLPLPNTVTSSPEWIRLSHCELRWNFSFLKLLLIRYFFLSLHWGKQLTLPIHLDSQRWGSFTSTSFCSKQIQTLLGEAVLKIRRHWFYGAAQSNNIYIFLNFLKIVFYCDAMLYNLCGCCHHNNTLITINY